MEVFLSIASMILSDINFMLAMILVILVSASFLGRYIVISKKLVIATCGVVVLQVIWIFIGNYVIGLFYPEVIEKIVTTGAYSPDDPGIESYYTAISLAGNIINGAVFLYAFIFYIISYKNKKFLRALEATVCLYLYYAYINSMIQYAYMFISGGDNSFILDAYYGFDTGEAIKFTLVQVIASFVINLGLILILYFKYYRKHRVYIIKIRYRILFIIWLFVFSVFPSIPFAGENVTEKYELLSVIFGILIPILGGLVPVIMVMNAAERNLKEKNEYQETYLNAELEYIEQYKRAQTETRAFRHDIINNLSLTNMMLDEGRTEEASQHLKELLGNVKALSPSIITGDEMLDCIVSMKAEKMHELGIRFTTDGVIDGGLHMKPMDVCSIFANALDNSIEAALKCKETGAWVDLNIKRTEKFFVIKMSNSAEKKVDVNKLFMNLGYTSKKDVERHGFGLRNIRQSVEKYNGLIKAESDDNTFSISVMVPR